MSIRLFTSAVVVAAAASVSLVTAVPAVAHSVQSLRAPATPEMKHASGTIARVNLEENYFVLNVDKGAGEPLKLSIDSRTSYTLNGKAASKEAALKQGAKASVTYDDKNLAIRAEVTSAEP
jgi:hypothetical protein